MLGSLTGFQRVMLYETYLVPIVLILSVMKTHNITNLYAFVLLLYITFISLFNGLTPFPSDNPIFFGLAIIFVSQTLFKTESRRQDILCLLLGYTIAKMIWYIVLSPNPFSLVTSTTDRQLDVNNEIGIYGVADTLKIDPNYFGFMMGAGAIISLLLLLNYDKVIWLQRKKWYKYILFLLTVLLFFFSLKGLSRGVFIAEVVSIFTTFMLSNTKKRLKVSIALLIFILLISYVGIYEMIFERFVDSSSSSRVSLLKDALSATYSEKGFFGIFFGCGTDFPWNKYSSDVNLRIMDLYSTHNSWLKFLINYGVVGFSLFVLMICRNIIRRLSKIRDSYINQILTIVFVYWAVSALSIEPLSSYFGWLLLIVTL